MRDIYSYSLNGDLENVLLLIERGVDINIAGERFQRTPLHLAASKGHVEIVKILLNAGADIYARDDSGHTALHLAAHAAAGVSAEDECQLEKYYQILRLFLEKEAQLRIAGEPIEVLLKNSTGNYGGTLADFTKRNKQVQEKFLEIVKDIEVNYPSQELPETSNSFAFSENDGGIRNRLEMTMGLTTVQLATAFWKIRNKDKEKKNPFLDENTQDVSDIKKKPHFS